MTEQSETVKKWIDGVEEDFTRDEAEYHKLSIQPVSAIENIMAPASQSSGRINVICFPMCQWGTSSLPVSRNFYRSYFKANKVSKSEGTRKVECAYNFWKCADAPNQNY